jgi:hypothetical protein
VNLKGYIDSINLLGGFDNLPDLVVLCVALLFSFGLSDHLYHSDWAMPLSHYFHIYFHYFHIHFPLLGRSTDRCERVEL